MNLHDTIYLFIVENGGAERLADILENENPQVIPDRQRWEDSLPPVYEPCKKKGCYFCQKMSEHKEHEPEYIMSRMLTLDSRYNKKVLKHMKYWRDDEVDFLIENYLDYKIEHLARKMKRSLMSVLQKKYRLRRDGVISF